MIATLEDAAIVYRHEARNLLIITGPAVVLGPLCVLIASSVLAAALLIVPLLMAIYLLTYAVSLRAAHLVSHGDSPDPVRAFLGTLPRLPAIVMASTPIALLLVAVSTSALIVSDQGFPSLAFGVGLLGAFIALAWMARHAYDLPLIMAYDVGAFEAIRAGRNVLDKAPWWTARVFAASGLPLMIGWLICWGLWAALAPTFGAAVFAALAAVWIPFAALSFVTARTRLDSEQLPAELNRGKSSTIMNEQVDDLDALRKALGPGDEVARLERSLAAAKAHMADDTVIAGRAVEQRTP